MDDVRMDTGALVAAVGQRLVRILIVTALLLAATFVVLRLVPKTYDSTAAVLFEPRDTTFTRAADGSAQANNTRATDDTSIASQIELIRSRGTLIDVIEIEKLRDVGELNGSMSSILGVIRRLVGRAGASKDPTEIILNNMAKRLTVIRARKSHVISITFRSRDPLLSARVANAIAIIHARRRSDTFISDTNQASEWLLFEIEKLRTRVAEAEAAVAAYRVDNDLFVGDNNTSLLDQQLSDIAAQIVDAQERKNTARSRASLISGLLDAGQPIDGVSDVRSSVVVQRLSEEKARLQGDRAQRLATLLPNHPDILALSAQIVEIDKQILSEGQQVADALKAEARIEAGVEQSLRDELTRLKINVSSATQDTVALKELEREANAQRALLETFLLRYRDAAARSDSSLVLPEIRVISEAAAAITPASPKVTLILVAVAMVSLFLQLGQVLFSELLSGRALTSVPQRPESAVQRPEEQEEIEEIDYYIDDVAEPDKRDKQPQRRSMVEESNAKISDNDTPYDRLYSDEEGAENPELPIVSAPEPVKAKRPRARPSRRNASPSVNAADVSEIGARLASGRENLVLVVTLSGWRDSHSTVEALTAELMRRELSVVEVDAGSRRAGGDLGLSDLAAGEADFGDVVHRGRRTDFAVVPWGQHEEVDFKSTRCATLVDALSDIFEIVIIDTGRAGLVSSLPAFAGFDALVLLAVPANTSAEKIAEVRRDLLDLDFENMQVVSIDSADTKVA